MSSEITYYFNAYANAWDNNPGYMVDNILTNYASTNSDGQYQLLNNNTCSGTNFGTITKVEIRAYGYGDVNDRVDMQPKFGGLSGDIHQTTPGTVADWGIYVDITTDNNAPSPWTWNDVEALFVRIFKENVSKGNMMYCAKVEIRVTYTEAGGTARSHGYIF